jgi:metal-responsive CopG/Arc/MetJ family transcriptional regulator
MDLLSIRLPKGMIEELDRYTEKLRQETPLLAITRTDTIRYLLARALKEFAGAEKRTKRRVRGSGES